MKSWISNIHPGWLSSPGVLLPHLLRRVLYQVRMVVAVGCSVALHGVLLSSAYSLSQPAGQAAASSGHGRPGIAPDKLGRNQFQVFLLSDLDMGPAPIDSAEDSKTAGPSIEDTVSGEVSLRGAAGGKEGRAAPTSGEPLVPLVPAIIYYRQDELDRRPEITKQIEPEFPAAVNPGTKGFVTARLYIGADGLVEQVAIVTAQPPGYFEEAVLKAFEHAQFTPGMRGGKPVRTQLTLAIDFASEAPK